MTTVYLRDGDYLELKKLLFSNGNWVNGINFDDRKLYIPSTSVWYIEEDGENEEVKV